MSTLSSDPAHSASATQRLRGLIKAYRPMIAHRIRSFGVPDEAVDDVVQDVFILAARKLEDINPGAESGFLFFLLRGVAANYRRARRRRLEEHDEELLLSLTDEAADPERRLSARRDILEVDRAIKSDGERTLTHIFNGSIAGLTNREIATELAIPAGTVASRLRRIRSLVELVRVHPDYFGARGPLRLIRDPSVSIFVRSLLEGWLAQRPSSSAKSSVVHVIQRMAGKTATLRVLRMVAKEARGERTSSTKSRKSTWIRDQEAHHRTY